MTDPTPTTPDEADKGLTLHRERAYLLGGYVAMFGGVFSRNDLLAPEQLLLSIESPTGQLSWPIHPDDKHIFDGLKVPMVEDYPWDGHTVEEKYLRVEAVNLAIPKMTYPKRVYGQS